MSYTTGSGSTVGDLLSAVKTFAEAAGWTTDRYTSGSLWSAHKGICHVHFAAQVWSLPVYNSIGGSQVTVSETMLRIALSTGFSSGTLTYYNQPGSPSIINQSPADAIVGNLNGPFSEWFLFSGGSSDHIHVVAQVAGDKYVHFSFGEIDKKGMSHSGVAYAVGQYPRWHLDSNNLSLVGFDKPASQPVPFATGGSWLNVFTSPYVAAHQHYAPNALPATLSWPGTFFGSGSPSGLSRLTTLKPVNLPSELAGQRSGALLDPVSVSPASNWSGYTPLWSLPVIAASQVSGNAFCYVGDYPDVRLLEMTGISPQDEIVLSGDTWKVFPVFRQDNWFAYGNMIPTTAQYGLAYKKIP